MKTNTLVSVTLTVAEWRQVVNHLHIRKLNLRARAVELSIGDGGAGRQEPDYTLADKAEHLINLIKDRTEDNPW